jgi:glycosyltransferase involved in cell wall biosynthesis
VSVQIITLNEEEVIGKCLASVFTQDPGEVVVVDGGSIDATVAIAKSMGARVVVRPGLGRGGSRAAAYENCSFPYVAMVDADDELPAGWLSSILAELRLGAYAALQGCLRVERPQTFWERGWDQYFAESIRPKSDVNIVGHPAVYRTSALRETRDEIGHNHEDTQLSVLFEERGLRQGISSTLSFRKVPPGLRENVNKWRAYGHGYREFTSRFPHKRKAILRHMLITIPLSRAIRPFRRGNLSQPAFSLTMAGAILWGYVS